MWYFELFPRVREANDIRVVSGDNAKTVQALAAEFIVFQKGIGKVKVELATALSRSAFGDEWPQGFAGGDKVANARVKLKGKAADRGRKGKGANFGRDLLVQAVDTSQGINRKVGRMASGRSGS